MDPFIPVYCISGLGADETVFEHLSLPGCALFPLPWLKPEPKEAIGHYAARMAEGIRHPEPILLGLSFGGIMAVEIARIIPLKRVWLISTVKQRCEMPPYMRFGAVLPLHRLALALNPHKWMGPLENYNLAVETPEERAMVARFRKTVDKDYLRWAIEVIVHWQNSVIPPGVLHIHGDKDRIFPIRYVRPDHIIEGGGHLLVHNRSTVVNRLLQEDLLRLHVQAAGVFSGLS
jgi:pimeloyl-ACP methyl ester carboxylesterase